MIYLIGILCTKLSILFLYLSLFKINRMFRFACYGMMGLTTTYCFLFFLLQVFDCNPPAMVWNYIGWKGDGHCRDDNKVTMLLGA